MHREIFILNPDIIIIMKRPGFSQRARGTISAPRDNYATPPCKQREIRAAIRISRVQMNGDDAIFFLYLFEQMSSDVASRDVFLTSRIDVFDVQLRCISLVSQRPFPVKHSARATSTVKFPIIQSITSATWFGTPRKSSWKLQFSIFYYRGI